MYDSDAELASDNRVGLTFLYGCCGRELGRCFPFLASTPASSALAHPFLLIPSLQQVILPQNMAGVGNMQSKQSAVRLTGMCSRLQVQGATLLEPSFSLTSFLIPPCLRFNHLRF
jgi:hypothetical protein